MLFMIIPFIHIIQGLLSSSCNCIRGKRGGIKAQPCAVVIAVIGRDFRI